MITFHLAVVCLFCVHIILLRPYRTFTTNLIYILSFLGLTVNTIFMYAKVSGYKQSIFVDRYFLTL